LVGVLCGGGQEIVLECSPTLVPESNPLLKFRQMWYQGRNPVKFYGLTLGILAVWRITHLLQAEDGPWDAVIRLRRLVGNGFWGALMDCFYCLSLWIAAPFAIWLGADWRERFLLWLSFSAGASLLQKLTTRDAGIHAAPYMEEPGKEKSYGMLWTEEKSNDSQSEARSGKESSSRPGSIEPTKNT
jgi:hypothetical protein